MVLMANKTINRLTTSELKTLIHFFEYDRIGTEFPLAALLSLRKDCGDWDGLDWDGLDAFFENYQKGFDKALAEAEAIMASLESEMGKD